ncbi:transposase family protein [Streptomyces sp. NPDC018036]|uniref:transposase family protein n=1 Tax=Streptomyces sp. NPDC018036 TaxID=3365035 RepID=UPI0037B43C05
MARATPSRSRVASPSPGRGAGAKHKLVFVDRLLATLVHLRHGATHHVLACWFDVDRSTITRAIGEVRPLPAMRGCTVAPDIRLRTLAEAVGAQEVAGGGVAAVEPGTADQRGGDRGTAGEEQVGLAVRGKVAVRWAR